MKKRKNKLVLIVLLVAMVCIGFAIASYTYSQPIPNPGHGGDSVFININGNNKDLQTAIDNGNFSSSFTGTGSYSGSIIHGHSAEEIIVNVNNEIKTFQQAINDGTLCLAQQGTSPSNFGTDYYGNNGDEILININGEKTLQQAINNGDFSACLVCQEMNLAANSNGGTIIEISAGGSPSNTINEIIDENLDSYYQRYSYDCDGTSYATAYTEINISFTETASTLKNLSYKWHGEPNGRDSQAVNVDIWLIQDDGTEIKISDSTNDEVFVNGPWTDIKNIRAYFWVYAKSNYFYTCIPTSAKMQVFEIQAWGSSC